MKIKHIAPEYLLPYLLEMCYELQLQRFTACQVPDCRPSSIEGRNIWVAESLNPEWYSQLIREYPKRRIRDWKWKSKRLVVVDSRIVRKSLERTLQRLAHGKQSKSLYASELIAIAEARHLERKIPVYDFEEYLFHCHGVLLCREYSDSLLVKIGKGGRADHVLPLLDYVAKELLAGQMDFLEIMKQCP